MSTLIDLTPEQSERVQDARDAEVLACPVPHSSSLQPLHFSGHMSREAWLNNACESGGRKLAGNLTFTGHAHCSCETCF